MRGNNPITKQFWGDGLELALASAPFRTLQGEGPLAGTPAVFIRLAHCNLRCHFCDTRFEEEWGRRSVEAIVRQVLKLVYRIRWVVITGGEPMLQNIVPLCRALWAHGLQVQVETAGTVWAPKGSAWERELDEAVQTGRLLVVVSPKTPRVHPQVEELAGAWKYIIRTGETSEVDGLPIVSTQVPGAAAAIARPPAGMERSIFVQPCEEENPEATCANVRETVRIALAYGYRLSLQLHKQLNLP